MAEMNGLPPCGIEAFRDNSRDSEESRAAQLIAMAVYAFGTEEQRLDIGPDADELGVPKIHRLGPSILAEAVPATQQELDNLTFDIIPELGNEVHALGFQESGGDRVDVRMKLWDEVREKGSTPHLLALLNFEQHSPEELSRTAAAAALEAAGLPHYAHARGVLEVSGLSTDPRVVELVEAAASARPQAEADHYGGLRAWESREGETRFALPSVEAMSVAVHGTWARLDETSWYAPKSALSQLIRSRSTPSLYDNQDHFRWTGGYSEGERRQGGKDLKKWLGKRQASRLDTVFAHSHGGNVVLGAAAEGVSIKLLVLLHTPAIPRPGDEWAKIRASVSHTVVLRTRLDRVVMLDGLRTGSKQTFDQALLPHREIKPRATDMRGWFSHSTYVEYGNWSEWGIPEEIRFEYSMA
ncbi:MAG: hypothetical protein QM705_12370 [Ancrocorticia sp.]